MAGKYEKKKSSLHRVICSGLRISFSLLAVLGAIFIAVFIYTYWGDTISTKSTIHIELKKETEGIPNNTKSDAGYIEELSDWLFAFDSKCSDNISYISVDTKNIQSHIDDSNIFRYSLTDWITLIVYPTTELSAIDNISLKFDPLGRKGAWILQVFDLSELLLEATYPNVDAGAVTTYYENTLYSGRWNWPTMGTTGLYKRNGVDCDLYRSVDSLIFRVFP